MSNKEVSSLQKQILSKKFINDIHQFFKDNYVNVKKIVQHGNSDTIRFYEIHFDNNSTIDMDIITKSLDKYGYTPKSLHGSLPDSFYLLVLVNKKI